MHRFLLLVVGLAACGGTPHASITPARSPDQHLLAQAYEAERLEQEALRVRQRVRTYLVGLGAVARPPRPAPRPEVPGTPPQPDAEWIAGEWIWQATAWVWHEGYWDWVGSVATTGGADGGYRGPRLRDHRRPRPGRFRDHRDGRRGDGRDRDTRAAVRDHRAGDRETWERDTRDDPPPARSSSRDSGASTPARDREETTTWSSSSTGSKSGDANVRDHRDRSDSKRDDDAPTIRDHRKGR